MNPADGRLSSAGHAAGAPSAAVETTEAPYGPDDAMGRLWVPHRMLYINGADKPATPKSTDCPFCDPVIQLPWAASQSRRLGSAGHADSVSGAAVETIGTAYESHFNALRDKLVVARGQHCYVILNLFPYNSGHMLVLPYRHVSDFIALDDAESAEFYALTKQAIQAAQKAFNPQGFNLGINQGSIAGAGIAAHLHQHVVPRWSGDANFLPIIGQTKAMPQFLGDTRDQLAANWPGEGAVVC